METKVQEPEASGISMLFLWRYLNEAGLITRKDGNRLVMNFAPDSGVIFEWRENLFSMKIKVPVNEDDLEGISLFSDRMMSINTLTKIYLAEDGNDIRLWFSTGFFCWTQEQFKTYFDKVFDELVDTTVDFLNILGMVLDVYKSEVKSIALQMSKSDVPIS